MKTQMRPLFSVFALLMLITGVFYPLTVTGLAQLIYPFQANGSLIKSNDQVVGSKLIGQNFTGMGYFWGRPSATSTNSYNAYDQKTLTGSSGSNLGPLSQTLVDNVQARVNLLINVDPISPSLIPVDLVTTSASGLDPDISVAAAYYQISRVAHARGMSEETVTKLVNEYIEKRQFGVLGEARVNVLELNLALEGIQ
jgi:potassium-transporting ATPase KdpC subunit